MINREDMLELTRRMTVKRNCFTRVAGAYFDEEGFVDGTFNVHYLKLSPGEQARNLALAKEVPFSSTNENLKEYAFPGKREGSVEFARLLTVLNSCGLKNDAMLDVIYELVGERGLAGLPDEGHAFFLFHGSYDVPVKSSDKERLWESEEVYSFLIGVLCPLEEEYEPGKPEWGFLYPAFTDRSSDPAHIAVYEENPARPHEDMMRRVLGI